MMQITVLTRLSVMLVLFSITLPVFSDVLVFGGTRGIGLEIVRQLKENGEAVTVLVRETSDLTALNEIDGVSTAVGDAMDMESVTRVFASENSIQSSVRWGGVGISALRWTLWATSMRSMVRRPQALIALSW